MYEQYYRLSENPFQLTPDERYFFACKRKSQDFDYLEYGLRRAEGIILVTGETGSGKTTLILHLTKQLNADRVIAGWIATTCDDPNEMLRLVAGAFDLPCDEPMLNKALLLQRIEVFLERCGREDKRVCLIVEDAQGMSDSALEELRMLSSYRGSPAAPVQIILLGCPELRRRLLQGPLEQLRQRVIASYHLPALDVFETRDYIAHRLKLAGWQGEPSLTAGALRRIHAETCGIAGKINLVCDRLLVWGGLLKKRQLDAGDVHDVIRELREKSLYVTARAADGRSADAKSQTVQPIGVVEVRREDNRVDQGSDEAGDHTFALPNGFGEAEAVLGRQHGERSSADERHGALSPDSEETRPSGQLSVRENLSRMPLAQLPRRSQQQALRATAGTDLSDSRSVLMPDRDVSRADEADVVPKDSVFAQRGNVFAMRLIAGLAALAVLFFAIDAFLGGQDGIGPPQSEQADESSFSWAADSPGTPVVATDRGAEDGVPNQETVNRSSDSEGSQKPPPQHINAAAPKLALDTQEAPTQDVFTQDAPAGLPADLDAPNEEQLQSDPLEAVLITPAEPEVTTARNESFPEKPASIPDATPIQSPERYSENGVEDDREEAQRAAVTPPHASEAEEPADSGTVEAFEPAGSNEGIEELARAQLTTSVRSREPVDSLVSPISAAQLPEGKLYYFTEIVGLSGGSVQHRWEYEGRVVSTVRFSIGSDRWRVYSAKTIGQNLGSWRVLVIDGRGNVLESSPFEIE